MELYQDLPAALQDLELDYMTLPELVERGVPLTEHRLNRIISNTLGEDFHQTPPTHSALLNRGANVSLDSVSEGLTAMLLLGQLSLNDFYNKALFNNLFSYYARQSLTFKQVVYPVLVSAIQGVSSLMRNSVLNNLAFHEAQCSPSDSALELLLNLIGPGFAGYIPLNVVVDTNPGFILNHLDIMPVTSDLIQNIIEDQEWNLAETLFVRFSSIFNKRLLEYFMEPEGLSADLMRRIGADYPFLLKYVQN